MIMPYQWILFKKDCLNKLIQPFWSNKVKKTAYIEEKLSLGVMLMSKDEHSLYYKPCAVYLSMHHKLPGMKLYIASH